MAWGVSRRAGVWRLAGPGGQSSRYGWRDRVIWEGRHVPSVLCGRSWEKDQSRGDQDPVSTDQLSGRVKETGTQAGKGISKVPEGA